jgi:acetolactate synthase-1/2/3 large subunit
LKVPDERYEVYNADGEMPPHSIYTKMKGKIKAKKESLTGEHKLEMSRRTFLKASAVGGSFALAAAGGLIALSGREGSDAVAATSDIKETAPELESVAVDALAAGESVPVENAAEAMIKLLEAYDVDYLFWTTDDEVTFLADKLTPHVVGHTKPRTILSMHEFGAFAAAAEYAAASEKVGFCCYGALMGPMNSHGAVYNAYNFRRPVVAISALNPGAGIPTVFQYWTDPGDLLREVTKWTCHFPYTSNLVGTFVQAVASAGSHPQAPVLISTFSDLWPKPMPGGVVTIPDAAKLGPAEAPVPNPATLEEAAELLASAENPIIISGLGRSDAAYNHLISLAEFLGAGVVDAGRGFNDFPWNHPLHIGFSATPFLADADVVFVIETTVPGGIPETAKVIYLDVDPVRSQCEPYVWFWKLRETDIRMIGEPSATLAAMMDVMDAGLLGGFGQLKKAAKQRAADWEQIHNEQRAQWAAEAASHFGETPISPYQLGYEINELMDEDTIWYAGHSVSGDRILPSLIQTDQPKSRISAGGGGHLGQTPYGAIGVACARPDKKIICHMGDGDWYWGHGDLALWSTVHEDIPVLYIIDNNHMWSRTKGGQFHNTDPDCLGMLYDNWWANHLYPPWTDLSIVANGLGVYGEKVENPADLGPALRRGMDVVAIDKKSAIIDVWTASVIGF